MPSRRYTEIQVLIVIVHVRSVAKIVFGASCYNCVGACCYNYNNARTVCTYGSASELCAENYCENTVYLTTKCEGLFHL